MMKKLPKKQQVIFNVIKKSSEPIKSFDIYNLLNGSEDMRTIRYAIQHLLKQGVIKQIPDLHDTRSYKVCAVR